MAPAGKGGLNFGWSRMEADQCFPAGRTCESKGLQLPKVTFLISDGHCSVVGGYVYRGKKYPKMAGTYLYSDWCSGFIWKLDTETAGAKEKKVLNTDFRPSSFGEDIAGELYVTDHQAGGIYRLNW